MGPREARPLRARIVFWFAFLGPLGNLIPVPGAPASFRFYYLLLIPAIFVYLFRGITRRTFHHIIILAPLLLYMMVSAAVEYVTFSNLIAGSTENPLVRFALFFSLMVFTICAADYAQSFDIWTKLRVIALFMRGYILSLLIGYAFFIGFYKNVFSLAFLARFEILVQLGFGLLRFSPGSYPNEYGIVSSFALSVLTLLLLYRKRLKGTGSAFESLLTLPRLLALFLLTLGALFLATTRAAYISYLLGLTYIGLSQGGIKRPILFLTRVVLGGLLLLACVEPFFDVLGILVGGYRAFFAPGDIGNGRLHSWTIALSLFLRQPYLGVGFGSVDMIHNVYLQLLFGLGILGFLLLSITALILIVRTRGLSLAGRQRAAPTMPEALFQRITVLALLHVCWFAFSNHNLNHFLTWFAVLLGFISGRAAEIPASNVPLPRQLLNRNAPPIL